MLTLTPDCGLPAGPGTRPAKPRLPCDPPVDKQPRPPLVARSYPAADQQVRCLRCPDGGIGRRTSFRCWRSQGRGGSSPLLGTSFRKKKMSGGHLPENSRAQAKGHSLGITIPVLAGAKSGGHLPENSRAQAKGHSLHPTIPVLAAAESGGHLPENSRATAKGHALNTAIPVLTVTESAGRLPGKCRAIAAADIFHQAITLAARLVSSR